MNDYDKARRKYKPNVIKILFVAEAPPESVDRFFYFEDVKTRDALFVNLMQVLYPELRIENGGSVEEIRKNKSNLLKRFQADGYYLIDALPEPISLKLTSPKRIKLIEARKDDIANQIKSLIPEGPYNSEQPHVGVVLIKATVFDALEDYLLVDQRLPILNRMQKVPFPSYGNTANFKRRMHETLAPFDREYRNRTKFTSYQGEIEITNPAD